MDMPDWWKELVTIPNVGDPKKFVPPSRFHE